MVKSERQCCQVSGSVKSADCWQLKQCNHREQLGSIYILAIVVHSSRNWASFISLRPDQIGAEVALRQNSATDLKQIIITECIVNVRISIHRQMCSCFRLTDLEPAAVNYN